MLDFITTDNLFESETFSHNYQTLHKYQIQGREPRCLELALGSRLGFRRVDDTQHWRISVNDLRVNSFVCDRREGTELKCVLPCNLFATLKTDAGVVSCDVDFEAITAYVQLAPHFIPT